MDRTMDIRRAKDRGHTQIDWLDSRHTFSFGDYHDPRFMGWRVLRVLNDDRVAAGGGFPTHAHRDMEILSVVLEGGLRHRDSLGTGSTIVPGDVQLMTAGTGVRHSEANASTDLPVHFLQIWIVPEKGGLPPGYQQKSFPSADRRGRFRLVASPDGRDGSLLLHQQVSMSIAVVAAAETAVYELPPGRFAYLHVARGAVRFQEQTLAEGDGVALSSGAGSLVVEGIESGSGDAEILLFDLP
jgi:redox-sensitive bicupin YhaK (pirin superfamily)